MKALCERLADDFEIHVLTQHIPGSHRSEQMGAIAVSRYRYLPDACEKLGSDGAILPGLKKHPLRWLALPFFMAAQTWAIRQFIAREQPDIIHAHWVLPQGLCALLGRYLARSNVPIVCTSHGSDIFGLRGRLSRCGIGAVLRRVQAITGVSRELVSHTLSFGVDPAMTHVMPMGIDSKRLFTPADATRDADARCRLLYVGRLSDIKGIDVLIDAMPYVLAKIPQATLTIVGGGEELPALRERAESAGVSAAVRFEGAVPHERLTPFYRSADCFVFPSRSEGLGLTMLEAMACGCPVIASDLPAVRDAITSGENGILVPPDDPRAIAEQIHRLHADPPYALRLARNARETAATKFDWEAAAERYRKLFRHLIEERPTIGNSRRQDNDGKKIK